MSSRLSGRNRFFSGLAGVVLSLFLFSELAFGKEPITVYLAGDSTMAEKLSDKRPDTGWGEALQKFFNLDRVRIENHAKNGRSTRTFIEEKLWQAIPVLLTPVMRRRFDKDGNFQDSRGEYPDIVRAVAADNKAALIDMHRKSEKVLKRYGVEESKKLFLQLKPNENANYPKGIEDNTHFSPLGAEIMAELAVEGIRELKLGLANSLKKPSAAESKQGERVDAESNAQPNA